MIHLDTHVLVWVYGRHGSRIPTAVQRHMEAEQLAISPIVELELTYLFEVGRVTAPAQEMLDELVPALELVISTAPFPAVVREAIGLSWTRDPFDRLIVAQTIADDATLLTADESLRINFSRARWD